MNLLALPCVIYSHLKGNISVCSHSRACLHEPVQQNDRHTNTPWYCQVLPVHWHLYVLARLNRVIIRFRVTRWHGAVKPLQNSTLKTSWCSALLQIWSNYSYKRALQQKCTCCTVSALEINVNREPPKPHFCASFCACVLSSFAFICL